MKTSIGPLGPYEQKKDSAMDVPRMIRPIVLSLLMLFAADVGWAADAPATDLIRRVQTEAMLHKKSSVVHWGPDPAAYSSWTTHSLRLIPVYTFGTKAGGPQIDLSCYQGQSSPYRCPETLRKIYGYQPENSVNPDAEYFDQTNIADIQRAAFKAGKKNIFLVVFDGMDWQTTRAAAIHASGRVAYKSGRGSGLHFQDYTADGTTQYGYMVTSPHNAGSESDSNRQEVLNPGGIIRSGYNAAKGGATPWADGPDPKYIIGTDTNEYSEHAYPDSANCASAMCSGVKTYKNAINVDASGHKIATVAHLVQEAGYKVGVVTSVPISHATPAASYAHNTVRHDFQDLSRDLLGQLSIAHPTKALQGMDVVIGGGYGYVDRDPTDEKQGDNYTPGLAYISHETIYKADRRNGGQYHLAIRTPGSNGSKTLSKAAKRAAKLGTRLLGIYGIGEYEGHLPYQTANGDYEPSPGKKDTAESYTPADLFENPTLAEMTEAAITVLSKDSPGLWLMVEAGDVDWANHDTNLDNSIGAVKSGDAAVRVITDWVEDHSNWDESLLIVTADHGHYLNIDQPEALVEAQP